MANLKCNEIFKLLVQVDLEVNQNSSFKNDTFRLYSRLLHRHFVNYRKAIWLTVFNQVPDFIFSFPHELLVSRSLILLNLHSSKTKDSRTSFYTSTQGFWKLQKANN